MERAKSNYYGKQLPIDSCFMSTTKVLLGNLTEIPVRNTCYCFQILTNFIVLAKKNNISAWNRSHITPYRDGRSLQ